MIGAGIAGLSAASLLSDAGLDVRVIERSSGPGGRMTGLRVGDAFFDHGAQFFTTRSEIFTSVVARALDDGAVSKWCDGFGDPPDGFPRYRGTDSMADLPAWMAGGLDVSYDVDVVDLGDYRSAAFVLTAPVMESLDLLEASDITIPADLHSELAGLRYQRTIAVLLVTDDEPVMPAHGGIQYAPGEDLAFVADNGRKGVSAVPALTVHLSNELSESMWNDSDDELVATALRLLGDVVASNSVLDQRVHRWASAGPVTTYPDRTVVFGDDPVVALAGEIFGGPKVEGAFLSGLAAAHMVIDCLS